MNITRITIAYSMLLIILGLGGYVLSRAASITALIPAFFGIVVLIFALLSRKEQLKKHAMHIAAVLGLIGFIATVGGLGDLKAMISGEEVQRQFAVVSKSIMAILSLAYVMVCIKSFIDARR